MQHKGPCVAWRGADPHGFFARVTSYSPPGAAGCGPLGKSKLQTEDSSSPGSIARKKSNRPYFFSAAWPAIEISGRKGNASAAEIAIRFSRVSRIFERSEFFPRTIVKPQNANKPKKLTIRRLLTNPLIRKLPIAWKISGFYCGRQAKRIGADLCRSAPILLCKAQKDGFSGSTGGDCNLGRGAVISPRRLQSPPLAGPR